VKVCSGTVSEVIRLIVAGSRCLLTYWGKFENWPCVSENCIVLLLCLDCAVDCAVLVLELC
jgi:hypothetical protein